MVARKGRCNQLATGLEYRIEGNTVRLARTILVALIAAAVAVVPATAGFVPVKASETTAAHAVHPGAMPVDCDHHAPPRDQGSQPADDCAAIAGCVTHCFNYSGTVVPAITPAPPPSLMQPTVAAAFVVSDIGSPPFRPPRV